MDSDASMNGPEVQLPAPHKDDGHKQLDPRIANEVMRQMGWDKDPNANKPIQDYLRGHYGDNIALMDMAGYLTLHEDICDSRGTINWRNLMRTVNVEVLERDQANIFFIEPFLATLYERHNGVSVDENLGEGQARQNALAQFWLDEYAEPMNNRMNLGIEQKPWEFNAQEQTIVGLAVQSYVANDPVLLERLTNLISSDRRYFDYITGLAGPDIGGGWTADSDAAKWYLSAIGGMFGEADPTRREFMLGHDNLFSSVQDTEYGRAMLERLPANATGLGLAYGDIGGLVLQMGRMDAEDFAFTAERITNPLPNTQELGSEDLIVGTAGFRKLIGNMLGATIATAGFAHLTAKATDNAETETFAAQTWSAIMRDLGSLITGQQDMTVQTGILDNIDLRYHDLYGLAVQVTAKVETEVQYPTVRVASPDGQLLSSAQFGTVDTYYLDQMLKPYGTQVDRVILENLLNMMADQRQSDERAGAIYDSILAQFPTIMNSDGRFTLNGLPQAELQRLWNAARLDTITTGQQDRGRMIALEIFLNNEPGMHEALKNAAQAEGLSLDYSEGKFSLAKLSAEDQQQLKLLVARIFMDTDFALSQVTAVNFEAGTGIIAVEHRAGIADVELGSGRNFENMLLLFGANRVEQRITGQTEAGKRVFSAGADMLTLLGGETTATNILQNGIIEGPDGAIANFNYDEAYKLYIGSGAPNISMDEFRAAIEAGFRAGLVPGSSMRGDRSSNDIFEKTMGIIDPEFEWTATPTQGTLELATTTRTYVPLFTVGLGSLGSGVLENVSVTMGETIGKQTTATYILGEDGKPVDIASVADRKKRDIYAQVEAQLNKNFSLISGIGPGASYGLQVGTDRDKAFSGSASLLVDYANGNLYLPVGLGFKTGGLQASVGINLLSPDSPISGAAFIPFNSDKDWGVQLGFSGGNFGITSLRVEGQTFTYIPGEPLTSALASFGTNLGQVFMAGKTMKKFYMNLEEARTDFVGNLPGVEFLNPEVIYMSSRGEVRRESNINQILSAIPLLGLIDPHGAIAHGTFEGYYADYINRTLIPGLKAQTAELENAGPDGPDLSNTAVRDQLRKDFQSNLTIYYILEHVAEREGLTGENRPAELDSAAAAIADYEGATAVAKPLNDTLRLGGMKFYEGELDRLDAEGHSLRESPTRYVEVAINRFHSDVANMGVWLSDPEDMHVVLNAENFASMMVIFSLWSHDDIQQLVSAIQSGHITFRRIEGEWDPTENVLTTMQQFNVTNAFGTTFSSLQDTSTFGELSAWMQQQNPVVIRGGAAQETGGTVPLAPVAGGTTSPETTERPAVSAPAPEPIVETGAVTELGPGAQGERVVRLKELLNQFMNYYGDEQLDTSSNAFDARTEESVKQMQRILKIEETGRFDAATENALNIFLLNNPTALGRF
ncbi:MAG: peptidoglycan-binding domain-containing protein [Candidatus Burarchaeum sp.]|nr:peptidoglycan-binding domain-containing protein [Candidatus Burarchaeum sp.]MDO8339926.1 peptidoglycan-binding domain-containing protein [Candidatus Burarchaeum sp.]